MMLVVQVFRAATSSPRSFASELAETQWSAGLSAMKARLQLFNSRPFRWLLSVEP